MIRDFSLAARRAMSRQLARYRSPSLENRAPPKRSRCVPFQRRCPMLDLLGAATRRLRISLSKSLRVLAWPLLPRAFHPIVLDHPKPLLILSRTNPDLVPKQSP